MRTLRSTPIKMLTGAAIIAIALSGCAAQGGNTTNPSQSGSSLGVDAWQFNAQPYDNLKDGGALSLSIGELTEQKNMFQADMVNDTSFIWYWYNPEMIKFKPNGDLDPNPNYITNISDDVVGGNTVVTYTLNPKAVFNDGTPIDVKAFQTTWKANNDSDKAYLCNSTEGYRLITSVEPGKDNFEVVVTFDGVDPWWGGLFNGVLHPSIDTADKFNTMYVGTNLAAAHPELGAGPYKLDSYDSTQGVATFVKNDKWWGNPGKLDKITITERDTDAAMNAFKNGETDVVGANTNELLSQIKDMSGIDIYRGGRPATYLMTLNSASPALSDIKVREAIMTAIDRSQIAAVLYQGLDYSEAAPGSLILFPSQTGYQDNFSQVIAKSDAAQAKSLIESAGYALGSDGFYAKDGQSLKLALPIFSTSATTKAVATSIQAQLKAVGVNIDVVQKTPADFSDTIANKQFDILYSGFASTDPYGMAYICQIYCTDSQLNNSGTGNADLDTKIHAVEKLGTIDEQNTQGNSVEIEALKTFGLMPINNGPLIYGVKDGLANVGSGMFAGVNTSIADFKENIGWVK